MTDNYKLSKVTLRLKRDTDNEIVHEESWGEDDIDSNEFKKYYNINPRNLSGKYTLELFGKDLQGNYDVSTSNIEVQKVQVDNVIIADYKQNVYKYGDYIGITYDLEGLGILDSREASVYLVRKVAYNQSQTVNSNYIKLSKIGFGFDSGYYKVPQDIAQAADYKIYVKHNDSGAYGISDFTFTVSSDGLPITNNDIDNLLAFECIANESTLATRKYRNVSRNNETLELCPPDQLRIIENLQTDKSVYQKGDPIIITYTSKNIDASNRMSVSFKRPDVGDEPSADYVRLSTDSPNSGKLTFTIPDHIAIANDFRVYVKDNESGVYTASSEITIKESTTEETTEETTQNEDKTVTLDNIQTNKSIYQTGDRVIITYDSTNLTSANIMSVSLKRDSHNQDTTPSKHYVRLTTDSKHNNGRLSFIIPDETANAKDFRVYVKDNASGVYAVGGVIEIQNRTNDNAVKIDVSLDNIKSSYNQGESITPTINVNSTNKELSSVEYKLYDASFNVVASQTWSPNAKNFTQNITIDSSSLSGNCEYEIRATDSSGQEKLIRGTFEIIAPIDGQKPNGTLSGINSSYTQGDSINMSIGANDNEKLSKITLH
ncbi:MAG: hypothetical protein U9N49_06875, partial [Campylobacterota bacterium]|nr:hypothetical protein [Campylobacterota bacterium]